MDAKEFAQDLFLTAVAKIDQIPPGFQFDNLDPLHRCQHCLMRKPSRKCTELAAYFSTEARCYRLHPRQFDRKKGSPAGPPFYGWRTP